VIKPGHAARELRIDRLLTRSKIIAVIDPQQRRAIVAEPAGAAIEAGKGCKVDGDE